MFVSPTGLPIHHADFYERVWTPLMGAIGARGLAPFRIHDLRHYADGRVMCPVVLGRFAANGFAVPLSA